MRLFKKGLLTLFVLSTTPLVHIPRLYEDTLSCKLAHFCDIPDVIPSLIYRRFTNKREC